jgi:protein SCO1
MSSDPVRPEPHRIPRLGWVIAFLSVLLLSAFAYVSFRQMHPPAVPLDRFAKAPKFQFTQQDGKSVSTEDLKGKVWVANFIFTRCSGPCPLMTNHMTELNEKLGPKLKDVQLVSITVDPKYDSPAVLKEYGDRVGATPDRWKFLTGSEDQIQNVVVKGFLQSLGKGEAGAPMHSTRFVVVDADGWIRSFQDGDDPELISKLLLDIGELLRESSTSHTASR